MVHNHIQHEFLRAHDEYADALFRHCYFRVYDRERAKDIVQDAFMKTWEYVAAGNKVDNLRAFLYRVANNLVIDYARKKKIYSLEDLQVKGFDPQESNLNIEAVVEGRQLLGLLDTLDDVHRQVIVMRYVDDLSPKEMASILGESENTISVRIHRAVKKVKEQWNKSYVREV